MDACRATAFVLLLPALLLFPLPGRTETTQIAVVYPELPAPYDKVFVTILGGIAENPGLSIVPLPLKKDQADSSLKEQMGLSPVRAVIALGPRGCDAAREVLTGNGLPILCGATVIGHEEGIGGISLATDPELMLERLSFLSPRTRTVYVIYDPDFNGWLMARAKKTAERLGLKLVTYEENNLRGAVRRYRALLDQGLSDREALWLPLDPVTVTDDVTLPMVLKAAWEERIMIISSKPAHVRKGALFSLYPDQAAMGRRLGRLALQASSGTNLSPPPLEPLKDVMLAVNRRTASHLGLRFDANQESEFALVFPSR